jgi:hypothetical protein
MIANIFPGVSDAEFGDVEMNDRFHVRIVELRA